MKTDSQRRRIGIAEHIGEDQVKAITDIDTEKPVLRQNELASL